MSRLEIMTLEDRYYEDAAALFCARYKTLRRTGVCLPRRYEEVESVVPLLVNLAEKAPGVAAIRGGQLVGFLIGRVLNDFRGTRSVISPEWANAATLENSRRIYEEMYAQVSREWVLDSCYCHIISMLANDRDGLEGWRWLGFGIMAVDATRGLKPVEAPTADVEIRRGSMADIENVKRLIEASCEHHCAAPMFLPRQPERDRAYYKEWLTDPGRAVWVAYRGGKAVACKGSGPYRGGGCDIIRDEKTAAGGFGTFTIESARGQGIATALLNRALEWARSEGYRRFAVDFEPVNIVAARHWLKRFRPVCYAFVRSICSNSSSR